MDAAHTEPASKHKPIEYPPFEAPLSTDLMTSVALTGTNHAEDQPVHLRVVKLREYERGLDSANGAGVGAGVNAVGGETERAKELERRREHVKINVGEYAGLLGRACPAGVYEYVDEEVSILSLSATSLATHIAAHSQGLNTDAEGEGWGGKKLVINSQVRLVLAQSLSP